MGGPALWALPGGLLPAPLSSAAPTTAPAERPVDSDVAGKVLSGTLAGRDREIGVGLPAAGAVVTSVETAVRGSDVPGDARATIEVRIGADGKVLGVRVVSASAGGGPQWDRVAKSTGAALAARAVTPTGGAAGKEVTVTVKVESKVLYPAGTKEKFDVQPVCAEEVIADLAETIGTIAGDTSSVARAEAAEEPAPKPRKICIPIGMIGQLDPANIGSRPSRVVTSSYKVDIAGEKAYRDPMEVDTSAPWLPEDPDKVRVQPKWKKKNKKQRQRLLMPAGGVR